MPDRLCYFCVCVAACVLALGLRARAAEVDVVYGDLINFQSDGVWSWYQDERVIVDNGQIILGSVAAKRQGDLPIQNFTRNPGDIIASTYNLSNGQVRYTELHDSLETDDHNAPAFLKLPDGNYLAAYTKHATDSVIRFRKTTVPGDATSWGPRIDFQRLPGDPLPPSGDNDVTYSNLHYLANEGTGQGRIYDFFRNRLASSWDRHFAYSDDLGQSWQYGGQLTGQNNRTVRPYPKYADNGTDKIYFVTSEANSGQSLWSGYVQGGKTYRMDGTVADNNLFDDTAPAVGNLTSVMMAGTFVNGVKMTHLWTHDLALDSTGNPVVTFRAYPNTPNATGDDHRHFYARWDGSQWISSQVAVGGSRLNSLDPAGNTNNSSLIALDPNDTSTVYFSSNADPGTGAPVFSAADGIRHFEIFKGHTPDGGQTWNYTQLTKDSSVDNIRPTVAKWDANNTALLWLRGAHDNWLYNPGNNNYAWDTAVVGLVQQSGRTRSALHYFDADLSNTVLADGTPWTQNSTYTTSSGTGTNDNLWHLRANASFGNGGTLFTANETTPFDESAGVLKTTVAAPGAGTYDVFAMFWSPSEPLSEWRIQATLDFDGDGDHADEQMLVFDRTTAQMATLGDFASIDLVEEAGNRHLYRGYLGSVTVGNGDSITAFIDDLANTDFVPVAGVTWPATSWRTWYDGIAIAAVDLVGDYNGDFIVDGDDLAAWELAFGTSDGADADDDGDSDGADFLAWQRSLGNGVSSIVPAAETVPEPGGLILSAFAVALAGGAVREKRSRR